jgi:hypothetical protein
MSIRVEAGCCGGQGPAVCGCGDRRSRGVGTVEGPCPLCGAVLEFFTDEVLSKDRLRCRTCRRLFEAAPFLEQAGR